jgi:hypothetical protein
MKRDEKVTLVAVFLATVSCPLASIAAPDDYGPFKYDGGRIACDQDTGPEIKQTQPYKAPSDRFFIEDSIKISEVSGWGKAHSCSLVDVQKKKIKVKSDAGEFEVDVVTEFSLYAHADCGSGVVNNSGGKSASVECTVSAKMQKYTND